MRNFVSKLEFETTYDVPNPFIIARNYEDGDTGAHEFLTFNRSYRPHDSDAHDFGWSTYHDDRAALKFEHKVVRTGSLTSLAQTIVRAMKEGTIRPDDKITILFESLKEV